MKKTMKKTIALLFAIALLLSILCVPAFAETGAETAPSTESAPVSDETSEPFSTYISGLIGEYAAEILSALSAVGALIVGILFKKGLLPVVSNSLTKIGDGTAKVAEETSKALAAAEGVARETASSVKELEDKLKEIEAENSDKMAVFRETLCLQTEMLGTLMLNLRLSPDQRAEVEKIMFAVKNNNGEGGGAE